MTKDVDNSTEKKSDDTIKSELYVKDDFSATEGRQFTIEEILSALDRSIKNHSPMENISHLFDILKKELGYVGADNGAGRDGENSFS